VVARLNRPTGLPQITTQRVDQPVIQRAVDAITRTLIAVVNFLQPFAQPQPWVAVPFISDWARGSTSNKLAQYRKDPLGYLELRGETRTVAGTSSTIAVLPEGFRPHVNMSVPVSVFNGANVTGRIDIQSGGRIVLVNPAVAANIEVYFDNVRVSLQE
jgi:hypothetical protein